MIRCVICDKPRIYVIVQKKQVVVMMYYLTASSLDAHFYCVPPNKWNRLRLCKYINMLIRSHCRCCWCCFCRCHSSSCHYYFLLLIVFDVHLLPGVRKPQVLSDILAHNRKEIEKKERSCWIDLSLKHSKSFIVVYWLFFPSYFCSIQTKHLCEFSQARLW